MIQEPKRSFLPFLYFSLSERSDITITMEPKDAVTRLCLRDLYLGEGSISQDGTGGRIETKGIPIGTYSVEAVTESPGPAGSFTLTVSGIRGRVQPGTAEADREALILLYEATKGGQWKKNANWLTDAPIGEWHGVTTGADGRVIQLDLSRNGLNGELPSELWNLTSLTGLYLVGNELSGELPPGLGGLTSLQTIWLSGNRLTGNIPPELGNLASLLVLGLNNNQLEGGIPPELGRPGSLRILMLHDNRLSGEIPPELGNPAGLKSLYLAKNRLTGSMPESLLDLPHNDFDQLDLPFSGMDRNAPEVDREALEILYHATGGGSWSNSTNWLTGAPIGKWHGVTAGTRGRVTRLNLSRNGLRGEMPPELGNLTDLTELYLVGNRLCGTIPAELGNLESLAVLRIHDNGLTGKIPAELGRLAKLEELWLVCNELHGEIPPELGGLTGLKWLYLSRNGLTGRVPEGLQSVPHNDLDKLDLPSGKTDRNTPETDRAALIELYAATGGPDWKDLTNWLTDAPVGDWHGVTTDKNGRVTRLNLSNNELYGKSPELGSLTGLTELYLGINKLAGEIPPELGGLDHLELLDLSNNELCGGIPPELGRLARLSGLWLYGNRLTGEIPPELGGLDNLTDIQLDRNELTGCVPSSLQDVLRLRTDGLPFGAP